MTAATTVTRIPLQVTTAVWAYALSTVHTIALGVHALHVILALVTTVAAVMQIPLSVNTSLRTARETFSTGAHGVFTLRGVRAPGAATSTVLAVRGKVDTIVSTLLCALFGAFTFTVQTLRSSTTTVATMSTMLSIMKHIHTVLTTTHPVERTHATVPEARELARTCVSAASAVLVITLEGHALSMARPFWISAEI
jgi:hypothetical protein